MAKFIKSFFNTSERRKNSRVEDLDEEKNALPLGRKLSISRSGKMKHASKKRHSLSLDVYIQDVQVVDTPKNTEVSPIQRPAVAEIKNETERRHSLNAEEEIDTAFAIINKTLITDL